MRVSTLVRGGIMAGAFALLAACGEAPLAPHATEQAAASEALLSKGGNGNGAGVGHQFQSDSGQVSFIVFPAFGIDGSLGDNSLVVPGGAICDPASSGYGTEFWDQSCTPAVKPFIMTATWTVNNGHTRVDFQPDIRFVPSSDPSRWAMLTLREHKAFSAKQSYNILWKDPKGGWIDESLTDPTLKPIIDRGGNRITRRVKHLSGYVVGVGFTDSSDMY